MKESREETLLRRLFDIGIFIKGIDGAIEFVGGLLFLFVSHNALDQLVVFLTRRELEHDPDDPLSNFIVQFVTGLPQGTKLFASFYLILHGLVKLVMVIGLWKDKLWAYPVSIGVITLFLIYQIYRLTLIHFSWPLCIFTCIDAVFVLLIWHEWNYHHARLHGSK